MTYLSIMILIENGLTGRARSFSQKRLKWVVVSMKSGCGCRNFACIINPFIGKGAILHHTWHWMGKGAFLHHLQMAVFVHCLNRKEVANMSKFSSYLCSLGPFLSIPSDKPIVLTFVSKMCHLRCPLGRHCTKYIHAYGTVLELLAQVMTWSHIEVKEGP